MRFEQIFEKSVLTEVIGTFGFYFPKGDIIIETKGFEDHADFIRREPEKFNVTITDDMTDSGVINAVLKKGWVRINNYKGAWYFSANSIIAARKAVAYFYDMYDGLYELSVDIGDDINEPTISLNTTDTKDMIAFIKRGKI